MSEPIQLSPKQISETLGISKRTIRRAIAAGELRAVRYNARVIRVPRDEVVAWHRRKLSATRHN